jgi:hypothetical protein
MKLPILELTGRERKILVTRTNYFFMVDEGLINVNQAIVNQTSIRNPYGTLVEDISNSLYMSNKGK